MALLVAHVWVPWWWSRRHVEICCCFLKEVGWKRVGKGGGDINRGYVGFREVKLNERKSLKQSLYLTCQAALIPRSRRVWEQTNPVINCHSEKEKCEGKRDDFLFWEVKVTSHRDS